MMAMSEHREEGRPVSGRIVAMSAMAVLLALFAFGAVAGAVATLISGQIPSGRGLWAIAIMLAVLLAIGGSALWGLKLLKPWAGARGPISPRTRKANNLLLLSGVLGGLIGAALAISTLSLDQPFALFSNSPMSRAVVIPTLAIWLLLVPLISWQWHRNVDEHEAEAYKFGGLAGLYLYAFLAPAWWLAARGGLVPAPDTMVIYVMVMAVWCVGWFWRRYR
jgi:MFS family permease